MKEPIKVKCAGQYIVENPDFTGCLIDCNNCLWYFRNGLRHRDNGPAVEFNKSKSWWCNGKLHREDGPAVEHSDGLKEWWIHGIRHRTDGPAIIWPNNNEMWYLNGKEFPEEEHRRIVRQMKLKLLSDTM
jgi:hypothetical protein